MADNNKNKTQKVIKLEEFYFKSDTNNIKSILSSISKMLNVNNFKNINGITFQFDLEVPNDIRYKFPKNIEEYYPKENDSLLEVFNEIIWLYLMNNEEFREDLRQFENFIISLKSHKDYEAIDDTLSKVHMKILDNLVLKCYQTKRCQVKSFQEYIDIFYMKYGFDLSEFFETKAFDTAEKYYTHQLNVNQNKLLSNLSNFHQFSKPTRQITAKIYSSKPIHKLIKAHSMHLEINPLTPKKELTDRLNSYYEIYSNFIEVWKDFETEVPKEHTQQNKNKKTNKTKKYQVKENSDLYLNAPHTIKGSDVIKKAMIIHSIIRYYQLTDIELAIKYYHFFIIKENYEYLYIDDDELVNFLNEDTYEEISGTISFKNKNKLNIIQNGQTKCNISKLLKLLNQYI